MHIYLLLTVFLLFSESKPEMVVTDSNFNIDKDIKILDSAVTRRNEYIEAKIQSIKKFKTSNSYTEGDDLYNYNKHLFNEYMKFDSDSALLYAYRCRKVATREGMGKEKLLADIDIAFITVLRGDIMKASQLLGLLPPIESSSSTVRLKTVVTWLELYMRILQLSPTDAEVYGGKRNIEARCKKLIAMLPQKGWLADYYNGIIFSKGDRTRLKEHIGKSHEPSVKAAMLCIAMAKVCKAQGDRNAYMHYVIVSAINDIKIANREASSLMDIAK